MADKNKCLQHETILSKATLVKERDTAKGEMHIIVGALDDYAAGWMYACVFWTCAYAYKCMCVGVIMHKQNAK